MKLKYNSQLNLPLPDSENAHGYSIAACYREKLDEKEIGMEGNSSHNRCS